MNGLAILKTHEKRQTNCLIKKLFEEQRLGCDTRAIKQALAKQGYQVSQRRFGRLMEAERLFCKTKKKFKATTNSNHCNPVAPNRLNREFIAEKPNQKWVGDITYIYTAEGWLYLVTVIDLFSRQVGGWLMNNRMTKELVNQALLSAIWARKPQRGLLWHTDRGTQYASSRVIKRARHSGEYES